MKRLFVTVLLCAGVAALAALPARAAVKAPPQPAAAAAVDSLELLELAVAKDSTRFDDLGRLGVLYLDRDQIEKAVTVLRKAHELKPLDRRVAVNLGAALDANDRSNEAQRHYRDVLAAFPDDSVASCRLASSLYSQGKHGEAVHLLDEIVRALAPRLLRLLHPGRGVRRRGHLQGRHPHVAQGGGDRARLAGGRRAPGRASRCWRSTSAARPLPGHGPSAAPPCPPAVARAL